MGSGASRGKKVAPACVTEINVTKTGPVASSKLDRGPFKQIKTRTALRNARNRAQPDNFSKAHGSDFSGDEDGAVLADEEDRKRVFVKISPPKRTFIRSKTYGLCHFSQEDNEDANGSSKRSEKPRPGASKDVNKRKQHKPGASIQQDLSSHVLSAGNFVESVPTPDKQQTSSCHKSSLTTPVVLYDGSEEELMDAIEREFS
uniref:Uncharacterized protein n=1 Tax=Iconisemion striatum TaxID=60296 RepID=A0A1A7XHS8_9TELE